MVNMTGCEGGDHGKDYKMAKLCWPEHSRSLYTQLNITSSHINRRAFQWPNMHTSSCFPFGQSDPAFVAPLSAPFSLACVVSPISSAAEEQISASNYFGHRRS